MIKILFSYPEEFNNEIEIINQTLVNDDIDFFHLRKPDFDYIQFRNLIVEIDEILHPKIVIHSHYGLIKEFDIGGINLNKKALNQLAYSDEVDKCFIQPLVLNDRQIEINRQQPNIVTYSAHSISEVKDLVFDTDYVFLSPIFDSISKENYQSNFDLIELKEDLKSVNEKVIALGGVTLSSVQYLQSVGFHGSARLGDFWKDREQTVIDNE